MTSEAPLRVLLVEDSPTYAIMVRDFLGGPSSPDFAVTTVPRLADAALLLAQAAYDIALLDLTLPDSHGLATVVGLVEQGRDLPIVVLTGTDDEQLALTAVQQGAQDYLVKAQVNRATLVRAIRYAVERHRLLAELRSLSLVDELTGLHNRRGFLVLAPQQIAIAGRNGHEVILLFADLDNMKAINDTWGHDEGDRALRDIAAILGDTFREADIRARLGGDEYAVLATTAARADADILTARLQANVAAHNENAGRRFRLSLSVGTVGLDAIEGGGIHDLLARADQLMYAQKRAKGARNASPRGRDPSETGG